MPLVQFASKRAHFQNQLLKLNQQLKHLQAHYESFQSSEDDEEDDDE